MKKSHIWIDCVNNNIHFGCQNTVGFQKPKLIFRFNEPTSFCKLVVPARFASVIGWSIFERVVAFLFTLCRAVFLSQNAFFVKKDARVSLSSNNLGFRSLRSRQLKLIAHILNILVNIVAGYIFCCKKAENVISRKPARVPTFAIANETCHCISFGKNPKISFYGYRSSNFSNKNENNIAPAESLWIFLISFETYSALILTSTAAGFEPARAEPNGFQVHLLNLSDTLSWCLDEKIRY